MDHEYALVGIRDLTYTSEEKAPSRCQRNRLPIRLFFELILTLICIVQGLWIYWRPSCVQEWSTYCKSPGQAATRTERTQADLPKQRHFSISYQSLLKPSGSTAHGPTIPTKALQMQR